MTEVDTLAMLGDAKRLMLEALRLLDAAKAWEPGAHLDLAIQRLNVMIGEPDNPSGEG
mgnify:CR=1 FL=1